MKKMKLNFNAFGEFALTTGGEYTPQPFGFANSGVTINGDVDTQLVDAPQISTGNVMKFVGKEDCSNGTKISYSVIGKALKLNACVKEFDNINAVYQTSEVIGESGCNCTLTQLCSANVNNVCYDDGNYIKDRLSDGSILIHYCQNKWQGEGQWRTATPEDLGIYYTTSHPWEKNVFRLDSASSWSTGVYFPLIIIEDKKKNECWFFEIESGCSWFFEIYVCGGIWAKFLSVKTGGSDERLGFAKKITDGVSYSSCGSVYGVVEGGFEEAVRELVKYKRFSTVAPCGAPLTFNDYMNCNWAIESVERLVGLIDRAAETGAEVFCIDDGWQTEQGIWTVDDSKFGDMKLQGIFDYIRSKGMIAGVWFEFELVPLKLKEMLGSDDIFLFRNDSVVASHRPLGNFRSRALLDYLNGCVDKLYDMGVRFIKNDHNNNEFIGSANYGESAGEGLENNNRAFIEFIDGLRTRHPDLIIENCGSGANRSDWGTLKHFSIQSTSDQEDYIAYTSILSGSLALMPPEKAGIWSYPYPLEFDDRESGIVPENKKATFVDGEQTVFNMVNGMVGAMYISGRIDQMDEYNFNLYKEGVKVYKGIYSLIKSGYPVWPVGMRRMSARTDNAVGIISENNDKMILAVWNLSDTAREVVIDLSKYRMTDGSVIYPSEINNFTYEYKNYILTCKFGVGKSAKLFKFNKQEK